MHRTTCGVTPKKVVVKNRKVIDQFIDLNESFFIKLENDRCLYENTKIISDKALNYLNVLSDRNDYKQLKNIIKNEFDRCEEIYPYLGDLFLDYFFKNKKKSNKRRKIMFDKKELSNYKKTIKHNINKQIFSYIVENCSLEYTVSINETKGNEVILVRDESISIDLEYDFEYILKNKKTLKNYKFVIIDGMIESVGEIHHLLFEASQTKEPYVVFCFGLNQEVSDVSHQLTQSFHQ